VLLRQLQQLQKLPLLQKQLQLVCLGTCHSHSLETVTLSKGVWLFLLRCNTDVLLGGVLQSTCLCVVSVTAVAAAACTGAPRYAKGYVSCC
jgi:hypothetical protein